MAIYVKVKKHTMLWNQYLRGAASQGTKVWFCTFVFWDFLPAFLRPLLRVTSRIWASGLFGPCVEGEWQRQVNGSAQLYLVHSDNRLEAIFRSRTNHAGIFAKACLSGQSYKRLDVQLVGTHFDLKHKGKLLLGS